MKSPIRKKIKGRVELINDKQTYLMVLAKKSPTNRFLRIRRNKVIMSKCGKAKIIQAKLEPAQIQ